MKPPHPDNSGLNDESQPGAAPLASTAAFTPSDLGSDSRVMAQLVTDDQAKARVAIGFGGRYELGGVLGRGGFGVVYKGFDRRLGRPVAIKLSRPDRANAPLADTLLQEARRVAQLQHSGIVTVHDVGETDGQCMIVSELLDGLTLDEWARRFVPSWPEIAELIAAVADALGHAHSRGIIHRDVKPSNVMVLGDKARNRPVLLDLGLALSDLDASREQGLILGTPAYMSPEQARGEAHQPDGRTDIYSLGVILYELITGRRPHRARETGDLLYQVARLAPQPPRQVRPEIPAELERICLRAMARAVEDRYPTAADFAADLRQFRLGGVGPAPAAARPAGPIAHAAPSPSPLPTRRAQSTGFAALGAELERRQVSVLRADFRAQLGDLPFGDDEPDIEEEHNRLTACHRIAEAAVLERSGLPLPSEGGTFLACFGYPTSREDSPRLAVAAGLDLIAQAAGERVGPPAPRLGVHTGPAVIGAGSAHRPPTILGEAITGVERLTTSAAPGELIIGTATRRLVGGFFECEVAGHSHGSGRPTSYRVVGAKAARNRVEASDPKLTPLIGRSREVELLGDRWDQATEGTGHVVMLVGDPGLGKSRLVHVLREQLGRGDAPAGATIVDWYGSEQHQNSPLQPAIDFFNRAWGLAALAHPADRLDPLLGRLRACGIADATAHALFASLLCIPAGDRLPALTMSPDRIKERLLATLLDCLDGQAQAGPVLFIVEDLHWIDPTTLDLLRMVVEGGTGGQSPGAGGILGVFTTRPEFEAPWKDKDHLTRVALTRLTRRQVAEMMAAQTGASQIPPAVVDQILDRTDGVPLFVEEFTRMIAEAQPNWANPGKGKSGDSSHSLKLAAIPATLHDLLVARLDRVGGHKEVVQLGAVIGRSFDYGLLAEATDLTEEALRDELAKLVATGLLFAKGTPPDSVYTFKHALIQDAAYGLLTKKPCQRYHRRVAEALSIRYTGNPDARPELLAHHYTEAGEVRRGLHFWLMAGQRSRERSAHVEAIGHMTKGLALVAGLPADPGRDQLELSFRLPLSASCVSVHGYAAPEVEEHNDRARAICEALGGDAPLFPVLMVIWAIQFIRGASRRSEGICGDLRALAEARDDDAYRTEAHWASCCNDFWAGEFARSHAHAEQALATYQLRPSVEIARFTGHNSGPLAASYAMLSQWALGNAPEAHRLVDRVLAMLDQLEEHPFSRATTVWHIGHLLDLAGDAAGALEWAERVQAISREQAFAYTLGLATGQRGSALLQAGDPEAAVAVLREGLRVIESTNCEKVHQHYLGCLAEACWRTGRIDEARAALDRAFALNDRDGERALEAELYRRRGMLLQLTDPAAFEPVEAAWLRSIRTARHQGARYFEVRTAALLAAAWHARGRSAEARAVLAPLVAGFPAADGSPDLARARAVLGQLDSDPRP